MTHDEYKGLLTVVSAVAMHALISEGKYQHHDQIVLLSVDIAQKLIDEVEDAADNS